MTGSPAESHNDEHNPEKKDAAHSRSVLICSNDDIGSFNSWAIQRSVIGFFTLLWLHKNTHADYTNNSSLVTLETGILAFLSLSVSVSNCKSLAVSV